MKKNVLVFGLISGGIVSGLMFLFLIIGRQNPDFEANMWLGYASMLLAFSFVFVGVKNFRDKYNDGLITFGKAFKVAILITLVCSTFYVLAWLIEEHFFFPDFMEKYSAHVIEQAKASGVTGATLDAQIASMQQMQQMYRNPLFRILMTYAEILPVGLIVSAITALILKKKVAPAIG